MKTLKSIFYAVIANVFLKTAAFAQCSPMIKIDGNNIITDENHPAGLKLPSWLRNPQTLEKGQYVFSISVIEFTMNGTALDYSQNISVTTVQTVPVGKVWKIESIHKDPALSIPAANSYTSSGTFNPTCTGTYRVQVWGGGGGGGAGNSCNGLYGGGGGAGGYAEGNFFLTAGQAYTVTIGAAGTSGGANASDQPGGAGGTSSMGTIGISATGGAGGAASIYCSGIAGVGGAGGIGSGGQINRPGGTGSNGGTGGSAALGGGGGACGVAGGVPGGGGGGGCWSGSAGSVGTIIISNSGTGGGSSTSRVPCVTLYQYSNSSCSATTPAPCPSGWIDAGCGMGPNGSNTSYCRTCYRCD